MRTVQKLLLPLLLAGSLTGSLAAQSLTISGDSWMPFNGNGTTETGFLIDLATKVFEAKGITVKYKVMPWSRAILTGRAGQIDAIVGAAKDDAPDFIFPKNEQGMTHYVFYKMKTNPWKFAGIESLKTIRLALVQDYGYEQVLADYVKANKSKIIFATGDDALRSNLKMMAADASVVTYDEQSVLAFKTTNMGLAEKMGVAGEITGDPTPMYIAFSPKNPKSAEYAKILSEGMDSLRASGELKKLLKEYHIQDWK